MERTFTVSADDPDRVVAAFGFAQDTLDLFGGAFTIAAIRHEVSPGEFVQHGYAFRYESFVPATRKFVNGDQPAEAEDAPAPQ